MLVLSPIRRLAIHTVVGTTLFALIGGATVLLHHAIVFIEYSGVSPLTISVLQAMEFLLFACDALSLVAFMLIETFIFLRDILRSGVSHDQTLESTDA